MNLPETGCLLRIFIGDHKPAGALVAVAGLPKGACVQITCIAAAH